MRKKADKSNPTKKLYQEDYLLPIGFAAKNILKKLKTKDKPEVTKFRYDVREFIIKIVERSPLQYNLTRSISSLSHLAISTLDFSTLISRFDKLVTELFDDRWITK